MAKKRKTRRKRKPTHCMMVIRVAVPIQQFPKMKVRKVYGEIPGPNAHLWDLEVLNAYYDYKKQPSAC